MPFTDPVSSVSGRNSRASNVSGVTGSMHSQQRAPPVQNDTLASAGVLSMLKTSTDTGDIGVLSFNNTRLPSMPRPSHQKRGHHHPRQHSGHFNPLIIGSNHHYAPSQTSRVSSSREWDNLSNPRRGSLTSMQSMPPSLPPVHHAKGPFQVPPAPSDRPADNRSYSMTSAPPMQQLPRHRSVTSLKSQGHEPGSSSHIRPGHLPPPTSMLENRSQYVYPTRLKRPGYRSPSPALSDTYAQGAPPPMLPTGGARRLPHQPQGLRPQLQTYHSDYGSDTNSDSRHLNVRAAARLMPTAPTMVHGEPNPYMYRNPAAARSAPGMPMPPHSLHSHPPPLPPGMMPRAPYQQPQAAGPNYFPRPGHSQYAAMQQSTHPGYVGHPGHQNQSGHPGARGPAPPPPMPSVAPVAHQIFHNAARKARQLPQRTDTPITNTSPPSSDPPSSGTAPSSSSPPTPKDQTSIQVVVDPAFIDPALADLQDSSSEPVLPPQYFQYAEGLEKDVDDSDVELAHQSVPPSGFVQRVRAMLESKAAADAAAAIEADHDKFNNQQQELAELDAEEEELHELAANVTPRFTIIEEFEAPVELPASPVRIAELGGSPIQPKRRITRELVKAELGSTSVDNTGIETDIGDSNIDVIVEHIRARSREEHNEAQNSLQDVETEVDPETAPTAPSPPNAKQHLDSPADSVDAASSEVASGLSSADYAMRFSSPADSTRASDETQSKDPFILDADTITLQQQRNKDKSRGSVPLQSREPIKHDPQSETEVPVSSLRAGEQVSRYSAVSPLNTQTLGIDETLHMASQSSQDDRDSISEEPVEQTVPGAFPEAPQPPPTPKTPKTYSKSVQIQPHTTLTDTPSSNRLSLPQDLGTVGDTTVNTASELVTDLAVRFSLPQTTITVSKPQIIEIPPSSSPERSAPALLHKFFQDPAESKSKRNSVTFADEIPPLKIHKKPEHHPSTLKEGDRALRQTKSIVRRPLPLQESADPTRTQRDSTTELRFSGLNGIGNRFGSTHLPGLKEESVEDMSISEKRATDCTADSNFPLPARIAAVKAMQERRLQESAEKAKARRAARHPNRPIAETRDLPSLNFSRMDLIDKLNEALEIRSSKSIDVIRRRDFSSIYCPSPQRPQSTEPLRERYMSFFSKPEDFRLFEASDEESDDEGSSGEEMDRPAEYAVPTVEVQPNTETELAHDGGRPLSPEDFLNVATQVSRLSIPSVSGLSDRLSELLPNLRDLQLDSILANFGDHGGDMCLGGSMRPDTVLSNRTSAGFRTLAERAEEIVKNGTHDSTAPANKLLATNKDTPALYESMSAAKVLGGTSADGKQAYLSGSVSAPSELGKGPSRPASALTNKKSHPTNEDEVRELLPPEMNPITRNSKRANVVSSASSRPWNQDENYPWADTRLDVDLSVPSEAHTRDSAASEICRIRNAKSLDLTASGELTNSTKGIDIGSIIEHNAISSPTTEQLTGVSPHHLRKQSKRSVIGSLTRKIGFGGNRPNPEGNTTRTTASPTVQSEVGQAHPHKPGERYPTSSLTPPAAFTLDEVRSFFSDNSSEKEQRASLRKRLTNFKGKGKGVRLDPSRSQSRAQSLDGNTAYDPGSLNVNRIGAASSANTYSGVGMGKAEFRIRRFGEKLRHLVAKGGELIRSWSQRSKVPRTERVRDDWLSDSLYSGV